MYCAMPRGAAHTASIESHRLGSEVSKRSGQNLYSTGFGLLTVSRPLARPKLTTKDAKAHEGSLGDRNLRVTQSSIRSREFRTARFVEPERSIGANPLEH